MDQDLVMVPLHPTWLLPLLLVYISLGVPFSPWCHQGKKKKKAGAAAWVVITEKQQTPMQAYLTTDLKWTSIVHAKSLQPCQKTHSERVHNELFCPPPLLTPAAKLRVGLKAKMRKTMPMEEKKLGASTLPQVPTQKEDGLGTLVYTFANAHMQQQKQDPIHPWQSDLQENLFLTSVLESNLIELVRQTH